MENVKAKFTSVNKRGSLLFLLMLFTLGQMSSAFAASESDCAYLKDDKRFVQEYRTCIRMETASRFDADCVDCLYPPKQEEDSWVDALNAVSGPLAFLGSAYFGSKYQHESQEAWANAYETGHQACTNRFNSYLSYNQELGASPILPDQAESFANSCNGNSYGSYAGHGGFMGNGFGGSGNPFLSAGYSPGFMQGMMGPNYGAGSYGGSFGSGYPGGSGFGAGGAGNWGGALLSSLLGGGGGINANFQLGAGGGGAYPGGWGMGPNSGSGYGYGMQMPGYGRPFPGVGYNGNFRIGAGGGPAYHGGGQIGFPGGPGAGGGYPGGYPGAGGRWSGGGGPMMCIQAPCPGGPGGGGYGPGGGGVMLPGGGGLSYPGSGGGGNVTCMAIGCPGQGGGGFNAGGRIGVGGRYPSNPWGGSGMVPGGAGVGVGGQFGTGYPGGSYWNNTGGWGPGRGGAGGGWAGGGSGGAGGAGGGAWYQQYQQQRRAQIDSAIFQQQRNRGLAQTRQSSSRALQENYQQAGQDLYQQSYGYGGMGSVYGGSPYGAGNLGLHFSVGSGYGSGYSRY